MAKKKTDKPEAEAAEPGTPPGEPMSKADAVRAAVAKGYDKPAAGVKFILDEFGIEITPGTFSATKAQQKNRAAKKNGKPEGGINPVGIRSAARATGGSSNHGKAADLARSVKELIAAYGADEVAAMVTVLAE